MSPPKIRSVPAQDPLVEPVHQAVSFAYTYDTEDQLILIEKTVGDQVYERTLTWVDGNLTAMSEWVRA